MNDKAMLERAARAAKVDLAAIEKKYQVDWVDIWNPLDNRINAFNLMLVLELPVAFDNGQCIVGGVVESFGVDKGAALRRAIVRAAAGE